MKDYDCVIIGGGISGLYILNNLKKYNFKNVLLLERSPFTGGKIKTLYNEQNEVILEKGPWRFHNSHKRVLNLLKNLKLEFKQNTSSQQEAVKYNFDICKKKSVKLKKKIIKKSGLSYKDSITAISGKCKANYLESFSKLPLIMDSTSKPYDVNLNYKGDYYIVKKGLQSITENLYELNKNNIITNCLVKDIKNTSGRIYRIYYQKREKNNYTNHEINAKYIFLCLPPDYTKSWDIIDKNLQPLIHSVDTLELHHIYGKYKNINNIYNNKFYINTNSELSQIISGDFNNDWFQISYSSGENAKYWNRIKLENPNYFKKILQKSIDNINLKINIEEIKSFYWDKAIHYWKPIYKLNVKKEMLKSIYPHPVNLPNLFWCGEAFSSIQGWIEGALETSDIALNKFNNLLSNVKIFKHIYLKPNQEYMIIDNRYIDIKEWKKIHPGSYSAIQNHLFEDISHLFRQINHSEYSWSIINSLQKYWYYNNRIYKLML